MADLIPYATILAAKNGSAYEKRGADTHCDGTQGAVWNTQLN